MFMFPQVKPKAKKIFSGTLINQLSIASLKILVGHVSNGYFFYLTMAGHQRKYLVKVILFIFSCGVLIDNHYSKLNA